MNEYRISKYDPMYRQGNKYLKDDWTDYSDIGKVFDGSVLSVKEYLRVEQNYISCIVSILQKSNITQLVIEMLENYGMTAWENKQTIVMVDLPKLIRDCMRNKCWCKLESNNAFVHFGYDYYVYLGSQLAYMQVESICRTYDLFVQQQLSPYT